MQVWAGYFWVQSRQNTQKFTKVSRHYLSICFLCPSTWLIIACLSDSLSCSMAICSKSCQGKKMAKKRIFFLAIYFHGVLSRLHEKAFLTWIRNLRLWKFFFTSAFSSVSLLWGPVHSLISWWDINKLQRQILLLAEVTGINMWLSFVRQRLRDGQFLLLAQDELPHCKQEVDHCVPLCQMCRKINCKLLACNDSFQFN